MNHKNFLLFIIVVIALLTTVHFPGGFPEFHDSTVHVPKKETIQFLEEIQNQKVEEPETISTKTILQTNDGLERKALVVFKKKAKGNVVLCHPATKNKEYMQSYGERLFKYYNHISFDFRRHGENTKNQYSTIGGSAEANEVKAAYDYLKSHKRSKKLPTYGFGISMGAAALVNAERKHKIFDGLILQSCYERLKDQIKRMYAVYRLPIMSSLLFSPAVNMYSKNKYKLKLKRNNIKNKLRHIEAPIFLVHAQNDKFIPITAFHKLKQHTRNLKKTWAPENGEHTNILDTYPTLYSQQCNEFLESIKKA